MTRVQPDPKQIILGKNMWEALVQVGVLPSDVYTAKDGLRLVMDDAAVELHARLIIPADKLRQALDIVDRKEGR